MSLAPEYIAVFGIPAEGTTHWSCNRMAAGTSLKSSGEALSSRNAEGIGLTDWPIDELSPTTIRGRWGAGLYRINWVRRDETGRRTQLGRARTIELDDPTPAAAPQSTIAAIVQSDPLAGFQVAERVMGVIDARTTSQLSGMLALAEAFNRRDNAGQSVALVEALNRLAATQEGIVRRLDALEAQEYEPDPAAAPAAATAPAADASPGPFVAGQPVGETAIALIGNMLYDVVPQIINTVLMKLQTAESAKMQAAAEAARAAQLPAAPPPEPPPQLAAPVAPPPASEPARARPRLTVAIPAPQPTQEPPATPEGATG